MKKEVSGSREVSKNLGQLKRIPKTALSGRKKKKKNLWGDEEHDSQDTLDP